MIPSQHLTRLVEILIDLITNGAIWKVAYLFVALVALTIQERQTAQRTWRRAIKLNESDASRGCKKTMEYKIHTAILLIIDALQIASKLIKSNKLEYKFKQSDRTIIRN